MRSVIAAYVENKYGVLARVSGLFMRRGFNIDSLTVGETEDPRFSRMTITLNGDDYAREQLINQLKKLYNVREVELLDDSTSVERELMIIKVANTPENRNEIMAAVEVYRAKIIDYSTDAISIEVTGEPSMVKAFIDDIEPLGILEMCRTGVVAIQRGSSTISK